METDSPPVASVDELSGQTLLAGGVWVIASSALPQIYVLASSILIARFLSVDDMGLQSFIAFVSASVIFVCSFGLSGSLVRFGGELVGRNELDRLRGLIWWTAKIQLAGAVIAGSIMVTIGLFSHDQVLWLWGAAGSAIGTIVNVPASVLFVLRRWREASVITLTIGLAYTIAIAVVLSLGWGLAGVFGIGTILGGIAAVWTSRLAWRHLQAVAPRTGPHSALHRPLVGYAATIWAGFLLTTIVMRRSEFFFLERYSSTKAIAYYSVAFAVIAGFGSAVEALAGVVAPTVASLSGSDEMNRVGPAFSRAIRLVLLVSVPIAALGTVFGPPAIRVVYGSDYARTAGPLRIMLLPFPLLALDDPLWRPPLGERTRATLADRLLRCRSRGRHPRFHPRSASRRDRCRSGEHVRPGDSGRLRPRLHGSLLRAGRLAGESPRAQRSPQPGSRQSPDGWRSRRSGAWPGSQSAPRSQSSSLPGSRASCEPCRPSTARGSRPLCAAASVTRSPERSGSRPHPPRKATRRVSPS